MAIEYPLVVDGFKRGGLILPEPLDLTEDQFDWLCRQLDALKILTEARARLRHHVEKANGTD